MTTLAEGLELEVNEGIGVLTLSRPESLNSLTFEMYRALVNVFADLQHDESVKVVIVTGTGKGFCSGGDVHDIIGKLIDYGPKDMLGFARMTGDVIRNMRRLKKPIVAALNGTAAGAGAVIALASDIRIASEASKVAFLFSKVGLTGADMGAAYLLPRVIGAGRATELLLLGDSVKPDRAERIGLVNEVVPPEQLMERAHEVARRLADGPTFSHGITKDLINNGFTMDLDSALDAEARAQTICMLADDFKEFHASFVEKRKPKFSGR